MLVNQCVTSKKIFSLFLAVFLPMVSCKTAEQISIEPVLDLPSLSVRIDEVLDKADSHAKIGVQIVSLRTGETVYAHNASQLFTPGSILKLYTAAAALHYLGPSFRFETKVFVEDLKNNQIGNLYVLASGDPSFSASDLTKIANTVKQLGIKQIRGNIIIDDSQFDDVLWGNGWMWNDMIKGYSAPIGALNVDYNRIAVFAWPQKNLGDPVGVTLEPYTGFAKLHVSAQTGAEKSPGSVQFTLTPPTQKSSNQTPTSRGLQKDQTIYVSGLLPKHKTYQYETFSIENPSLFAGHLLREQLERNGVKVHGHVAQGELPKDARQIDSVSSRPLAESLIDFVKFSNNQAMETLLKTIGLQLNEAPGTFEKGIQAVRQFLNQEVKMKTKGLINADASGLSRYSMTSPAQMTDLLRYVWDNFRIGPEFIASLPIAGEDGTLSNSWKNSPLKNRIRAKTGGMTSICSLAGYLEGFSKDFYAFTIMINGTVMNGIQCRVLMDQMLMEVLKPQINQVSLSPKIEQAKS